MEENKSKNIELNTKDFYKYLLAMINADMVKEELTSFKIRTVKENKYFVSQSTYNNIKKLSEGKNIPLISNPKIELICKRLKIKLSRKYVITK